MTGVLARVLGAPVIYRPVSGPPVTVRSIFREQPVEVTGEDGHPVLIEGPSWRVARNLVAAPARGDEIETADGRRWRVLNRIGSGSPAGDAFFVCELEKVVP